MAELVAIQQQFTSEFAGGIEMEMNDLQSRKGDFKAEIMSFFKKWFSREELLSLKEIMELETRLNKERWRSWASVLRSWNLEPFQQFVEKMDKFKEAKVNVRKDVVETINSVLDTIKKITSIPPKIA